MLVIVGFQPMASHSPIHKRTDNNKQNNILSYRSTTGKTHAIYDMSFTHAIKVFTLSKLINNITHTPSV